MEKTIKDRRTKEKLLQENEELRARLEEAEQTLDAIRSGDVDALVVAGPGGERVFSLTGAEQIYRVIIEAMNEGALTTDLDGRILFCNRRFCEMMKMRAGAVIGKRITRFTSPSLRGAVQRLVADAQVGPVQRHLFFQSKGGKPVPTLLSANLVLEAKPPCICVVVSDLTELEAAASSIRILREQREALEAVNKELDSFSYSVSHDLRAPLRAIDGFARMILKQNVDKFDRDARGKFEVIRENTRKMGQLIDELLAFSRLGRAQLSMAVLDVKRLIEEVWGELKALNPNRRLSLRIAKILPCRGDRGLVKQALANLLSNAIKFTGRREEALIEAGCDDHNGETIYYIRDNGAGFDMRYYGKMFGVFQRLHGENDFEGTGVGLAIVQRIINRHGGRIWAEGEIDKGATFFFTLPPRQE